MSDTTHHRKPGTPARPRKGYIPRGREAARFRTALAMGDFDAFATRERTAWNRTR